MNKYNRRAFLGFSSAGTMMASGLLMSCSQGDAQKTQEEENKAICRRYYEESLKNLDLVDEIFSPDYVEPQNPNWSHESHKQYLARNLAAFPDIKITIVNMIAEGDRIAIAYIWTGTHLGEYRGVAPTGNKINIRGMHIFRIVDGKIVHGLYNFDSLGLLRQIGYELVPPEKQ